MHGASEYPKIRIQIEPGLHALCDPVMARSVLHSLISNSIKFTRDSATPLIEVGTTHLSDRGNDYFFVRDNGCGFDMKHYDKLFKPFQKLHMPDQKFEGHGIGVATASRIVQLHRGEMFAVSSPNQGATFYFSFGTVDAELEKDSAYLQESLESHPMTLMPLNRAR